MNIVAVCRRKLSFCSRLFCESNLAFVPDVPVCSNSISERIVVTMDGMTCGIPPCAMKPWNYFFLCRLRLRRSLWSQLGFIYLMSQPLALRASAPPSAVFRISWNDSHASRICWICWRVPAISSNEAYHGVPHFTSGNSLGVHWSCVIARNLWWWPCTGLSCEGYLAVCDTGWSCP